MSADLVCPGCRTRTAEQTDIRTLTRPSTRDVLACACGRRYPIVDGVPIALEDPRAYLQNEIETVVEREVCPEAMAQLVADGPDDAPYPRLIEHLSIYIDAHWGDRAEPPPDGPGAGFGAKEVVDRIAERARDRVALAVELGCSVGRVVATLAAGADHVVGVDLKLGAIRRARRILDGERVEYDRRVTGRHYAQATVTAGDLRVLPERMTLVCGDALDPPLIPGVFDRVVALNLLDSVHNPSHLLSVVDGLCAPGGEVILSSPYAWQSGTVGENHRIGGADPAGHLVALLRDGVGLGARYRIEDEAELTWSLRRDARSAMTYRTHYVRARKS